MNKKQAKDQAYENDKPWSYYMGILNSQNNLTGVSKLNKNLTKTQVFDIFNNAMKEKNPDQIPDGTRYILRGRNGRITLNSDGMLIQNILIEFG